MKLKLLQMPVVPDILKNSLYIRQHMQNTEPGTWIVTPECALSGYLCSPCLRDPDPVLERLLQQECEKIEQLRQERELGLILGSSWAEPEDLYRNQARVYHPTLGYGGYYAKQSLCMGPTGGAEEMDFLPGHHQEVWMVDDTPPFSTLICNDLWHNPAVSYKGNPYYAHDLRDRGCQVLFVIANCNVDQFDQLAFDWHVIHLRMTAREMGMTVVIVNPSTTMKGHPCERVQVPTGVINPLGEWVAQADSKGEQVIEHTIV